MVNSHPGLTLAHLLLLLGTAAQFCDNELDVLMGDMEVSGNGVPQWLHGLFHGKSNL